MPKILIIILAVIIGLIVILWLGLQVPAKSFPAYVSPTQDLGMIDLPQNLPAPVEAYYQAIGGPNLPLIDSAVISGTASIRLGGITFPGRFRFIHEAGRNYRHYIETTWFGIPIMKVNERYIGGKGVMELPFGVIENEPKVDMAANLGLWSESIWLPSILFSDDRVEWREVDEHTALLRVPFGEDMDQFTVYFDPDTGLLSKMEAMRYKGAEDEEKVLWTNDVQGWSEFNGLPIPNPGAAIWADEGTPWAVFTVTEVVYNADVTEYIRAKGQ
jgi:hypothetical protein